MTTPAARATTLAYVDAVHRRFREPVQPEGFTPDWDDRPLPHTHHPDAVRIALPFPAVTTAPPGPAPAVAGGRNLTALAEDLRATAGVLARRCQIDWNRDLAEQSAPHAPRWGRGASSGGGTYPLEVYWAAGPSGPVPPGVYHYASGLHALERLTAGDPTATVRAALGPDAIGHDQFLLCTVRPWKNAFKYHNLAYHLATLDLGSFLASWELTSRDRGVGHRPRLRFDEDALNALLGLDPDAESVHAVVPLDWRAADGAPARTAVPPPAVRPAHHERSRTVRKFEAVDAVRRATAQNPGTAPAAEAAEAAAPAPGGSPADRMPLPAAATAPAVGAGRATLAARTSSSGRIDASRPLGASALAAVLAAAFPRPPAASGGFVEAAVVVRAAEGLPAGGYAYVPAPHALEHLPGDPLSVLDRDLYGLDNYDVAGVPVVLVLHWHPERAVTAHGARAYRSANAEAGAAAQRAHLAATALGLASGIVFGIDPVPLDEALGLTAAGRRSQLCVFLGLPRPGAAALDGRLV
ncbi:SagB family peptide dehydrogenase [Streptomyces sp. NPDC089799]|uniref:SagB family peptide dehydrogenase n=1 Tax=Streptomyces sp. NPDC089799 TaxID=3155066 RepID=UPI00342F6908